MPDDGTSKAPLGQGLAAPVRQEIAEPPRSATDSGRPLRYPPILVPAGPPLSTVLIVAVIVTVLLVIHGLVLLEYGGRHGPRSGSARDQTAVTGVNPASTRVAATVSVGPDLIVKGTQTIDFDKARPTVTWTVPSGATSVAGHRFEPRVEDIRVVLGDGRSIRAGRSLSAGSRLTLVLPAATRHVQLSYVASGVAVKTEPFNAGQVLALVTPLELQSRGSINTATHIKGGRVTNVGCVPRGRTERRCGTHSRSGWTVNAGSGRRHQLVFAQIYRG
jgi:hypothetical protein